MASPTWWTCVLVNSRIWWWTGRPGVLRFMGWQRVGHDWATELNWDYGGGNEDNGGLPQKIPSLYCYGRCPQPCSRSPPTHAFSRDSWTPTGKSPVGTLFLSLGSWCTSFCCALQESISKNSLKFEFRIKPCFCQRCSEGSNKPCAHQDPGTPQRLRQNCVWASPVEVRVGSGLSQGQRLWVWVWHKSSWRRSSLTPL